MKTKFFFAVGLALAIFFGFNNLCLAAQVPDKLPLGSVSAAIENATNSTQAVEALLIASTKPISSIDFKDDTWIELYAKGTIASGTAPNFPTVASNAVATAVNKALTAPQQYKDGTFHSISSMINFDGIAYVLQTNTFALVKNPDNSYSLPPGVNNLVLNYDNLHNFVWKQIPGLVWAKMTVRAGANSSDDVFDTRNPNDVGAIKMALDYLAVSKYISCNIDGNINYGTVEIGLDDGTTAKYDLRTGNKIVAAPTISVVYTNGVPKITITGEPGKTIVIQATTNLQAWADISTETIGQTGVVEHQCPLPPPQQQFYRAGYQSQ